MKFITVKQDIFCWTKQLRKGHFSLVRANLQKIKLNKLSSNSTELACFLYKQEGMGVTIGALNLPSKDSYKYTKFIRIVISCISQYNNYYIALSAAAWQS